MKQLSSKTILSHGRYFASLALSVVLMVVGIAILVGGLQQIVASSQLVSFGNAFSFVLFAFLFFVFGWRYGLKAIIDNAKVVAKIRGGRYRITKSKVTCAATSASCATCCGGTSGSGFMLQDGSAFVDNSGKRETYTPGEEVYLLFLEGENLPADVFKACDYTV